MRIYFSDLISRSLFAVLATCVLFTNSFGQLRAPEINPATRARIDSYLNGIEKAGFTGSVLVERDGRVVVSRAFGMRDMAGNIRNDTNSVFDIGSLTKQFTAAAILKLEMQGKLSTDDKIGRFFPSVPEDKSAITIHDLLRHSSGLKGDIGGDYEKITREEFVAKLMSEPLESNVGERFSYSNIGYSLLAMIVEKASGQAYEDFLYENLFRPAGMRSTGYSRPKFDPAVIAVGYRWDGLRWGKPTDKPWDGGAPFWHLRGNGGILSTVGDLVKWSVALRGNKILSAKARNILHHPRLRPNEDENPYYAYGWDMLKTKRNTYIAMHDGTNNIFYADVHRFLDERITIIQLANKGIPSLIDINRQIARIIFEPAYIPVVPAAETQANRAFSEELVRIALEKGVDAALSASKSRSSDVAPIERFVRRKGFDLIDAKKFPQAIDIFTLNTLLFPRSPNAFGRLGEAYLEAGNKKLAIENYKKSLELDPENTDAERMLAKLREQ